MVICRAPSWNYSQILLECKRAQIPKLLMCHNRHIIIRAGQAAEITPQLLPKGTNHAGVPLEPVCSLQRKNLSKGKHQNVCEVTDPELRTSRKCSYRIHIEESSGPQPHATECKNRTVFANRNGSIHSKPVRFILKIGEPSRTRIMNGNCKPKGNLRVGTHSILCKATDPYTKVTGTCSYWLRVKEKTCPPLPEIPNAGVACLSQVVGAVCHYECNEGYTFRADHLSKATKSCHSNMKWQPEGDPVCEIEPPELVEGCENLEAELSSSNFTIPLPRYTLTSLNETLNVTCTPSFINAVGYYEVWCAVEDDRFNSSCNFSVTAWTESELTTVSDGTTEGEYLQLIEGCIDLQANMSSPFNYTVPVPIFLTTMNETLPVFCTPSYISAIGQHAVTCAATNGTLDASCYFNITIYVKEEQTTVYSSEILELVKNCEDIEVNLSTPIHFAVPEPQFLTSLNRTLNVSCTPYLIAAVGKHQVTCTVDDGIFSDSCHFNVTIQSEVQQPTVKSVDKNSCSTLSPPQHGSVECSTKGNKEYCQVTCDPGYGFSEDNFLSVVCVGGFWDFQEPDTNGALPDCFAQMEGSAVEVWISFEAFAPHCEEELEEQIKELVNEMCQSGTDCSKVTINCTLDEESDLMLMTVNWTVEADFNDEEYYESEEIPEAEIRLESVMERTRAFLASEDIPGVTLFQDSFRRGLITLVCPDGFIPNGLMSKCIQCPKEMEPCL